MSNTNNTIDNTINFGVALKKILQEGTLAWEYNPFRNYRLDEGMIYYKGLFHTKEDFRELCQPTLKIEVVVPKDSSIKLSNKPYNTEEGYYIDSKHLYKDGIGYIGLFKELKFIEEGNKYVSYYSYNNDLIYSIECQDWSELGFPKTEEIPVVYLKGLLVDFITDEFDFDLNHPVLITPSYSYDNSVDLIINDGKSLPKIINSRFSAIGKNKYLIVDRNGNNDTNIYDKGTLFDIDTSLYKTTTLIPEVYFGGESYGGNLKVGNYHFYFKYADLDGNESDFVALSGLVSVFLGSTPLSINSGFRDENSNKRVRFILSNIDESYDYILVYYTRATSEEFMNRVTLYIQINLKYKISLQGQTIIDITGFEDTSEVTFAEINERLQLYDSAKTQAVALNMLFLGNTTQSHLNHDELTRLALFIIPEINTDITCEVDNLNLYYLGPTKNTYYDPNFIYNYTGYWDDELYRFGVVFIRENNTITPVYNTRGLYLTKDLNLDELIRNIKENKNFLITYNEVNYLIDSEFAISDQYLNLENAKGVCYIPALTTLNLVIGISFKCPNEVINKLKELKIKGFFIVRLKRIPTTLCQAYTIGLDSTSHTPMIPIGNDNYIYESFLDADKSSYTYFDKDGRRKEGKGYLMSNIFLKHKRTAPKGIVNPKAAICPDYDVDSPYYNLLFTGENFVVTTLYSNLYPADTTNRLFTVTTKDHLTNNKQTEIRIIGVEDDVKLVGINNILFSSKAGWAEEAFRYEYVGTEVKTEHGGNNLIRGSFGPYLGISGYDSAGDLITIKIPGYSRSNLEDYFKIRYNDASMFYPISNRITFNTLLKQNKEQNKDSTKEFTKLGTFYRGDCYICKFTHRLNRNFRDASTPTNDNIVDPSCWTHNINFEDNVLKKDSLEKINLGDVNAVNLGMWITFTLRSTINHSIRSVNKSNTDEDLLIGNSRGFFPYYPISAKAAFKTPETGTYNKGFEASVGELVFEELPTVPYYKDVFSTRVAYSNLQVTSSFKNAYRVFTSTHYRDYPITYGEITKLIEWNGDLICVMEHGVYRIPVNERAIASEGSGGFAYINTSNVLPENPKVISDTFGSQWIDSIIKTPAGIYGVDTVAKKIWKVDDSGMELISDYKVQEFLNDNITLTERELTPIIGIRNVKTHYNAFKHDVMFTFYDDLNGFEEAAWNLCWNESMNKWITFYSWIPSFSENIYNQYFSFDRETSKLIAKLALNQGSLYNTYIYLDPLKEDSYNLMTPEDKKIGTLKYDLTYDGTNTDVTFKWELIPDRWNNYEHFHVDPETGELKYKENYSEYVENLDNFKEVVFNNTVYTLYDDNKWKYQFGTEVKEVEDIVLKAQLKLELKKLWKRSFDDIEKNNNGVTKQKVYLLNVRVTPTVKYNDTNASKAEYVANLQANSQLTGGYIDRIIAVTPKEHLEALTTDFWKHGQSGIIDIKENIKPTNWYGKVHPFEFEFIIRDAPDAHKVFDNLIIISNKAKPESFHYEIVGECYDFANDKKNMYIRQEATKELFQNQGYDISYNKDYKMLTEYHRPLKKDSSKFDKSTIFPAYYYRYKKSNAIEDAYHTYKENSKDFSNKTGSEIVYYDTLNEFRVWTHLEAVDIQDEDKGRLRGNMHYKEDKWYVQVPTINFVENNEDSWDLVYTGKGDKDKIPIELLLANFVKAKLININTPLLEERGVVFWSNDDSRLLEAKLKDKYIKIRIRYSGEDLAVISAIKTLYSISYA